jgi:hypothetical protein
MLHGGMQYRLNQVLALDLRSCDPECLLRRYIEFCDFGFSIRADNAIQGGIQEGLAVAFTVSEILQGTREIVGECLVSHGGRFLGSRF